MDIEKIFFIKEFFQNYSSTLTNQQNPSMKSYFIQLLQDSDLIESEFKSISSGKD
jgi:predicted DNA-binding protein YlxM (UPF0122 family)